MLMRNNVDYLYFHNKHNCMHHILSEAILLERIGAVFGGSLDAVDVIVDEMDSNPYAFAYASDNEWI